MTDERRDDTDYVQGFLDQGEPIPGGEYWCPDGVMIPGDYCARADAAGRERNIRGAYPLATGPVMISYRGGSRILPRTLLDRLLRRGPRQVDMPSSVVVSVATISEGDGEGGTIGLGRNGCAMTYRLPLPGRADDEGVLAREQ